MIAGKHCATATILYFLLLLPLLFPSTIPAEGKEVKKMVENIHWLGHDTFKITGEKLVYTDPFRIKKKDIADLILITHEHYDHCSPEDIKKI